MGKMSRTKGKVGEREVAELLRSNGFHAARRGVQYQGGPDSPDVTGLPGFHNEVKRTEAFRLYAALEQAKSERKAGDLPVVWHRANQRPWVVVMDALDFLALVRAAGVCNSSELDTRPDRHPIPLHATTGRAA